jgi:uncharacterized membrane protein
MGDLRLLLVEPLRVAGAYGRRETAHAARQHNAAGVRLIPCNVTATISRRVCRSPRPPGQCLYFEEEPGRRSAAKLLAKHGTPQAYVSDLIFLISGVAPAQQSLYSESATIETVERIGRTGLRPMAFLQHVGPQAALAFAVTATLPWMGLVFGLSKLLRDRGV